MLVFAGLRGAIAFALAIRDTETEAKRVGVCMYACVYVDYSQ